MKTIIEASSQDKFAPITQLVGIEVRNGYLYLSSTDMYNYLYGKVECDGELESLTVSIKLFYNLIKTFSTEDVKFELKNSTLHLTSNGTYKLPATLDATGQLVQFPKYFMQLENSKIIKNNPLQTLSKTLTLSVADEDFSVPEYSGTYFREDTIVTNLITASKIKSNVFNDEILMTTRTLNILAQFGENFEYEIKDDVFLARNNNLYLYSKAKLNKSNYQYDDIKALFEQNFETALVINVKELKETLRRYEIFKYLNIKLKITDKLVIKEKQFSEIINIDRTGKDTEIVLDFPTFRKFINSVKSDDVAIKVSENHLLISDVDIQHIIGKVI